MGSGFSKMKKQAKLMEEQFHAMQEEKSKTEVSGTAGNGLVSVVLTGDYKMKKITISKECLQDPEGLQDLIIGAHNSAVEKIEADEKSHPLMKNLPFKL